MRFTFKKEVLLVICFRKGNILDQVTRLRPLNIESRVLKLQQMIWDL